MHYPTFLRTLYSHSSCILSHLPSHTTLYRQQSFFPCTILPSLEHCTVILPAYYLTFLPIQHCTDNSGSSHALSHLPSCRTVYRQLLFFPHTISPSFPYNIVQTTVILPKHYPTFLLVEHCTDNSGSSHMLSHLPSHTTLYRQQSFFPSTIPPSFL